MMAPLTLEVVGACGSILFDEVGKKKISLCLAQTYLKGHISEDPWVYLLKNDKHKIN